MSKFSDNIKRIRYELHMTQEEFAALLGTTKQNISRYESGAVSPKISTAAALAEKLGVSLADLNGETQIMPMQGGSSAMPTKRIPILGDTAAGEPIYANRVYDEYIEVPTDGKRFDAAVRVTGDSMEPGFKVNDLALIREQPDVEDGQIAVICLDDEVTLKRIYHVKGGVLLQSDNPAYKPFVVTEEDYPKIHLVGRAVGVIRWVD